MVQEQNVGTGQVLGFIQNLSAALPQILTWAKLLHLSSFLVL